MLIKWKELYDGFYDGVTGLVTQPRYGYKEDGAKGMAKGIGRGIGGVFLKPPAGMYIVFDTRQSYLGIEY